MVSMRKMFNNFSEFIVHIYNNQYANIIYTSQFDNSMTFKLNYDISIFQIVKTSG